MTRSASLRARLRRTALCLRPYGLLPLLLAFLPATAQGPDVIEPVSWTAAAQPNEDGSYELVFTAAIEDGWKLYGMDIPEGGPIPTSVHFADSSLLEPVGDWKALGRKKTAMDPLFGMEIETFQRRAIFRATVRAEAGTLLEGYVEYMSCDDAQCIFPDPFEFTLRLAGTATEDGGTGLLEPVEWRFSREALDADGEYLLRFTASIDEGWKLYSQDIPEADVRPNPTVIHVTGEGVTPLGPVTETGNLHEKPEPLFDNLVIKYFDGRAVFEQRVRVADPSHPVRGEISYMTCDASKCLFPDPVPFAIDLATGENVYTEENAGPVKNAWTVPVWEFAQACVIRTEATGWWAVFLRGLLGGLIALFTPCVFPMIPMTVSFFTKKAGQSRAKGVFDASFYGLSILAVYLAVTIPFVVYKLPPDTMNVVSTHPVVNLAFFAIFLFFAFSFFGYYELTLPSSWGTRTDSASQAGGLLGIFFMALTLAVVSFSCTGPLLGVLLVQTLSAEASQSAIVAGFAGFGVALGLPFALFAAFPRAMNALPQSGGWLNSVKVVLGFAELALALKFLSNADLVSHWGILKRDLFLLLWIGIAFATAAYLLGLFRFPHDSPLGRRGPVRLGFAGLFLAFGIYLVPGLFGANLKLISGFPPPMFYSYGWFYDPHEGGVHGVRDFEEGLALAREQDKPILVDFTGWACVNCRKMEEGVWVQPEVAERLTEDYVLVSLYVDDTEPLPEEERYTSAATGRNVRTVGNKWSDLQITNFKGASQPWYVLLAPDGRTVLNEPVGYTPDAGEYLDFLDCGLRNYDSLRSVNGSGRAALSLR